MRSLRTAARVVLAAAAVSSFLLVSPADQASAAATTSPAGAVRILEAPAGPRCGAFRETDSWTSHVMYRHCGTGTVKIEIDQRDRDNTFGCVPAYHDTPVGFFNRVSHAWAVGWC